MQQSPSKNIIMSQTQPQPQQQMINPKPANTQSIPFVQIQISGSNNQTSQQKKLQASAHPKKLSQVDLRTAILSFQRLKKNTRKRNSPQHSNKFILAAHNSNPETKKKLLKRAKQIKQASNEREKQQQQRQSSSLPPLPLSKFQIELVQKNSLAKNYRQQYQYVQQPLDVQILHHRIFNESTYKPKRLKVVHRTDKYSPHKLNEKLLSPTKNQQTSCTKQFQQRMSKIEMQVRDEYNKKLNKKSQSLGNLNYIPMPAVAEQDDPDKLQQPSLVSRQLSGTTGQFSIDYKRLQDQIQSLGKQSLSKSNKQRYDSMRSKLLPVNHFDLDSIEAIFKKNQTLSRSNFGLKSIDSKGRERKYNDNNYQKQYISAQHQRRHSLGGGIGASGALGAAQNDYEAFRKTSFHPIPITSYQNSTSGFVIRKQDSFQPSDQLMMKKLKLQPSSEKTQNQSVIKMKKKEQKKKQQFKRKQNQNKNKKQYIKGWDISNDDGNNSMVVEQESIQDYMCLSNSPQKQQKQSHKERYFDKDDYEDDYY